MTVPQQRVRVLCVDDEPYVLESLALQLRRGYDVATAATGADGLTTLRTQGPFAVVLSDMRMPGMSGAEFLAKAKELAPDSTRMLLTGQTDMASAISAINEGQIFRFLTKPCAPLDLRSAFDAAAAQYRLVTSEKVLLEQTLLGSVKTLSEILSIASPLVFGRASRVQHLAKQLGERLTLANCWAVEVAAMLAPLGYISVPEGVAVRHFMGDVLTAEEQVMVTRAGELTESLLSNIPRLELVREILTGASSPTVSRTNKLAGVLRIATDYDDLEARNSGGVALATLKGRHEAYDSEVLEALVALKGAVSASRVEVRELPIQALAIGMVCADDVRTTTGLLLVSRGFKVTAGFLARAKNFGAGYVKEPVRVLVGLAAEGA